VEEYILLYPKHDLDEESNRAKRGGGWRVVELETSTGSPKIRKRRTKGGCFPSGAGLGGGGLMSGIVGGVLGSRKLLPNREKIKNRVKGH